MKKFLGIFLYVSLTIYAQSEDLFKFIDKQTNRVELGSSIEEVKKILKSPTFIEDGFPNSEDFLVYVLPDKAGQLLYTTWYFKLPMVKLTSKTYSKVHYYINAQSVQEDIFNQYSADDSVFTYEKKIIFKGMAESYSFLKDKKLRRVAKRIQTKIDFNKGKNVIHFDPYICIVFDKSMQTVVKRLVFLQVSDINTYFKE